jgi:hypothetical protein
MTGYDTTTIGKAFEATFQNPHWEAGETAKGAHFVEFTGMLPENLYKERYMREVQENQKCLEEKRSECGESPEAEKTYATVTFQWIFAANRESFQLGFIDEKPWFHTNHQEFLDWSGRPGAERVTLSPEKVLAFVYQ